MCTLFVFAKADNDHPDPKIDAAKYKVGHVIDVLDEDDASGGLEVDGKNALGWWTKVVIPGVPAAKYRYLCDGDPTPRPGDPAPTTYPRLRINVLDLAAVKLAAPVDQKGTVTVPSEAVLTDAVSVAQRKAVATVIGDDPAVIG